MENTGKYRKEVTLDSQTLNLLKFKAEQSGRNLKNYMEYILKKRVDNFVLSDKYKEEIDKCLDKREKGEINFISKDDFFKKLDEL